MLLALRSLYEGPVVGPVVPVSATPIPTGGGAARGRGVLVVIHKDEPHVVPEVVEEEELEIAVAEVSVNLTLWLAGALTRAEYEALEAA